MWWVGDWLNYGERKWGEMYSQALEVTDYSYQTLMNAKWVAGKVDFSMRIEKLSFSHHMLVAPMEPDEQEVWLTDAESEGWSTRDMRRAIDTNCSPALCLQQ